MRTTSQFKTKTCILHNSVTVRLRTFIFLDQSMADSFEMRGIVSTAWLLPLLLLLNVMISFHPHRNPFSLIETLPFHPQFGPSIDTRLLCQDRISGGFIADGWINETYWSAASNLKDYITAKSRHTNSGRISACSIQNRDLHKIPPHESRYLEEL